MGTGEYNKTVTDTPFIQFSEDSKPVTLGFKKLSEILTKDQEDGQNDGRIISRKKFNEEIEMLCESKCPGGCSYVTGYLGFGVKKFILF